MSRMGGRAADRGPDLPVVVATSVVRSAYQGQSHGGVHLVDLQRAQVKEVLNWDTVDIDWTGRGGDRGLRGVAFWENEVYLAASDEIFVYDREFTLLRSFRNPYLGHCHEIDIVDDRLYLTSCAFDSVLEYDLPRRRFTLGYCVRHHTAARTTAKLTSGKVRLWPSFRVFDPERKHGPRQGDTCHINSVVRHDGNVYLAGRQLRRLYAISDRRLRVYATIPFGTHNAQPCGDGVVFNDTNANRVVFAGRDGNPRYSFDVQSYAQDALLNLDLAQGHARQAFGRGLVVFADRFVVAGSSPATITVHDLVARRTVRSINLSMDVRNAIHGLEVWPFAGAFPHGGQRIQ